MAGTSEDKAASRSYGTGRTSRINTRTSYQRTGWPEKEILKAIAGTSDFDRGLLKEMLEENKNAQLEAEEDLQKAKQEVAREEENLKQLEQQYQHITAWANEFEDADVDRQKMILARLIERIEVGKGYDIGIKFFLSQDTFAEAATAYKAS